MILIKICNIVILNCINNEIYVDLHDETKQLFYESYFYTCKFYLFGFKLGTQDYYEWYLHTLHKYNTCTKSAKLLDFNLN